MIKNYIIYIIGTLVWIGGLLADMMLVWSFGMGILVGNFLNILMGWGE